MPPIAPKPIYEQLAGVTIATAYRATGREDAGHEIDGLAIETDDGRVFFAIYQLGEGATIEPEQQ